MRRTAILLIIVAVGLVAAAEQDYWVGPNPMYRHDITDPQPGVFPPGRDVFQAAVDTFGYDDGTARAAFAWARPGFGAGVKFINPTEEITVNGALLYFAEGWPDPGGDSVLVSVFADDGIAGSPGTELWASDTLVITRGQWNFVPIDLQVNSNYYIFYMQAGFFPNCPGISKDGFRNSSSGRQWIYADGFFLEDFAGGDWMIRSVVDWSSQDRNARALFFAEPMALDTLPEMLFPVSPVIGNYGNDPLPAGTPVKLRITGPRGYVYEDEYQTGAALGRGEEYQVDFEDWIIPLAGDYEIQCWPEAAGEQYPADDTISFTLSAGNWSAYGDPGRLNYISRIGPERAVRFNPVDFGLNYPVEISRVRHHFWHRADAPWADSSFTFKVYGSDGRILLYESPPVQARVGAPGRPTTYDFDSLLVIESGTFHVAVRPTDTLGYPSSCADNQPQGRSYSGSPGNWTAYNLGEFLTAVAIPGLTGISEGERGGIRRPEISLEGYPNPTTGPVTVRWNLPREQTVLVNLYDASGRRVQELYSARAGAGSGSAQADMRSLASGVYLLRLDAADGAVTRKLVIR